MYISKHMCVCMKHLRSLKAWLSQRVLKDCAPRQRCSPTPVPSQSEAETCSSETCLLESPQTQQNSQRAKLKHESSRH